MGAAGARASGGGRSQGGGGGRSEGSGSGNGGGSGGASWSSQEAPAQAEGPGAAGQRRLMCIHSWAGCLQESGGSRGRVCLMRAVLGEAAGRTSCGAAAVLRRCCGGCCWQVAVCRCMQLPVPALSFQCTAWLPCVACVAAVPACSVASLARRAVRRRVLVSLRCKGRRGAPTCFYLVARPSCLLRACAGRCLLPPPHGARL